MGSEPYRFGRFTLDPANRELRADGTPIPLGATDFRLLLTLIERTGSVVTKDELMSRVWGKSAVGDNTLHVHITALRKALGDDFIATKQGRGYRFVDHIGQTGRAATHHAGNLPAYAAIGSKTGRSRLIGRDSQIGALSGLLAHNVLVTLVGPGGVGKTRLALEVANQAASTFRDGAWLVELASVSDGASTAGAVATVLGIKIGESATPFETLARQLARRNLLIVLDNCEQIIASCAALCEAIVGAAPNVRILATSRESLSCLGEQLFEVPPLALPGDGVPISSATRKVAAVKLFVERARGLNSDFKPGDDEIAIVARLCRRLDGLPLAIEMVASWAGILGLPALEAKLNDTPKTWLGARRTAPLRHSTLRATLEWSHDLLSPEEQIVLRRLAVFAGHFSMPAAEAVVAVNDLAADDVLRLTARLIGKSMLAVVPGSRENLYRLLETTRAFMLEKLGASDDPRSVRLKHADYVLRTLRQAMRDWETMSDAVFLERYAPVLDDLRAALDWCARDDSDLAIALAGSSWPLWRELPVRAEGRRRLSAAVSLLKPDTPWELEAHLRRGMGQLYFNTAAVKDARLEFERAVALFRALNDAPNLGSAIADFGYASLMLGNIEEAHASIDEALQMAERAGRPRALAAVWAVKFCVEARLKSPAMREAGMKAVRLCEAVGADRAALVVSANLVEAVLEMGEIDSAISGGQELAARLRDTFHTDVLGYVLGMVSSALSLCGDTDAALTAAREAVPLLRDEGMLFWFFDHMALRLAIAGQFRDAAQISGYADCVFRKFGRPREPVGQQAVSRLSEILRASLSDDEIEQLREIGNHLSEDRVIAIALRTQDGGDMRSQ
ncbi:MAG TPA: winged helix-turn-helix domain-containing protein [Rhizomicrobium sp.]|jgi:predicted ATPase/DNA-binding winged helix-turn-helix (wHTH) protein|nr:winged helix-turn-helix domain-containing protein [Rhizomicrobium sp.]